MHLSPQNAELEPGSGNEVSPRLAREQPVRIAGKAAHRAQRHVTDDAGNPQFGIVETFSVDIQPGRDTTITKDLRAKMTNAPAPDE